LRPNPTFGTTTASPQQVTQQLAIALRNNAGQSVDITLNPSELGHVRISLSTGETGVIVSILAERPETMDLLRRHADLLAQDFRDIGYDSTEFSFHNSSNGSSGAQTGRGDTDQPPKPNADNAVPSEIESPVKPTGLASTGTLDVRV
jgi:flagellar hook-length control protein FliK